MAKTVFVTGGAGFIGRELTRKLLRNGYKVTCFDMGDQFNRHADFFRELGRPQNLTTVRGTILDRVKVNTAMVGADVTVHLAAMLGVRRTEENRLKCLDTNVNGTDVVLSACVFANVGHVIFASSSEVYGEPARNPVKETDPTQGKTVYAVSKLAGEELTKGYHQLFPRLDYTIVRLFNTYGEGQVAQFVLARFVKSVREGNSPQVFGDGTQQRSYGHVDDVTDGILAAIEKPVSRGKVYNLGNSAQLFTLRDLAQKVIDVLAPASGLSVQILDSFEGADRKHDREVFARYCDTTRAREELGFQPKITIEEGIRRIAASGRLHDDWPEELAP
jgi:UDP-glucose 4-epimerase